LPIVAGVPPSKIASFAAGAWQSEQSSSAWDDLRISWVISSVEADSALRATLGAAMDCCGWVGCSLRSVSQATRKITKASDARALRHRRRLNIDINRSNAFPRIVAGFNGRGGSK
jgi:hypothetical protein